MSQREFNQKLRDSLRSLEIGELGDTYVSRSTVLGYNLIPTDIVKDPQEKRHIHRMNCYMDLYYFISVALGKNRLSKNPDKARNLHYQMCLIPMKDGLKEGIEIPRDHYKSTIYSEGFPIWRALPFGHREQDLFSDAGYADLYIEWLRRAHDQDIRILLVSETITNAVKLGSRIANHYESNQTFRQLFPELMPTEKEVWTKESMHQRRTPAGRGQGEGTFDFIGVGAALQSRHYNVVVEDDLVGREARKSSIVMADTIDYHQILVGATDSDPDNPGRDFDEIVVGNRWSHDDLNSYIRAEEPYFNWTTHSALGGCCSLHPFGEPIFPETFTREKLLRWKKRLGSYHFSCFPADAPVLMADLTEKSISTLQIGDEIVGYDTSGYMSLAKATVQHIQTRTAALLELTLQSGRKVICTPEHKFLKAYHRERGTPYESLIDAYSTSNKKGGHKAMTLVSVYEPAYMYTPNTEQQRDLDWLAGMFDGEGSCGVNAQPTIAQSKTINPLVCNKIEEVLQRLGISFSYSEAACQYLLHGGRSFKVWLLKHTRMAKWKRFGESLWHKPGRVAEDASYDEVISFKSIGNALVYNIQSSTGNYVAYGYATKNCQFLNFPIDPSKSRFNMGDFRYFNFEKVTGALSIPKELPAHLQARLHAMAPPQQYRVAIRHHVAQGDVEKDIFPRNLDRYMVVDPNHGGSHLGKEAGKGGRCRHAIAVTGVSRDPRRVYLLDQWAKACPIKEFVQRIFFMAIKWKLTKIHVEAVGAQKYLLYHLKEFIQENSHTRPELAAIQIVELFTPQQADAKMERIENFIPLVENHEFWLDVNNCVEFKEEVESFGQRKGLVDLLDVISYGLVKDRKGLMLWKFDTVSEDSKREFLDKQMGRFRSRMASACA